ncbi:MAG TPA: trypsin-like peptidase domain-containing protein [Candidatus Saccharimonadales bacterium]|nr:trypsin-like peptidase domain-containing protein [Candidatus Saccharimonadales bacterium]
MESSDRDVKEQSATAEEKKSEASAHSSSPSRPATTRPHESMVPHRRVKFLAIAFLLILSVTCGFLGGYLGERSRNDTSSVQKQQVVLKTQGQLISSIAKNVGQSVVSVNVTGQAAASSNDLSSIFGGQQQQQSVQSAGTGIILTSDGLIITNRHVVPSGTTSVSVMLSDGTEYDNVQVIGRTSSSDSLDIAFLKIPDTKGKTLVPATLGDSSKMQIGDNVIAIGNALGQFQNTVTSGIISGYGRSVQASDSNGSNSENLEDLFQTDAAINEGNSGGPLVNLDGQVIGINTAIAGDAQSIGFAIPVNDITGLINSVKSTGKLQRPYIGVMYVPLTDDVAKQYNLSTTRGAYIPNADATGQNSVIAGGPAANAGVKAGDIITKVNDTAIDQNNSLTAILDKHAVGDKVTLTILRGSKTITIDVTLAAAPTS